MKNFGWSFLWGDSEQGVPQSLYWNPEMVGGGDIVDGVGDVPDSHVWGNNDNTISATFTEGGSPAYIFNEDNVEGRAAFRQIRSSAESDSDLEFGHRYRFSAQVYIDGYDGSEPQMLRGLNVNNNAALLIYRESADHSGANGSWEAVDVVFDVIGESNAIFLAHGQGVIVPSNCEQRTRDIRLTDLGITPLLPIIETQPPALVDGVIGTGLEIGCDFLGATGVRWEINRGDGWLWLDEQPIAAIVEGLGTETISYAQLTPGAQGEYRCVGTNLNGSVTTDSCTLDVIDDDEITFIIYAEVSGDEQGYREGEFGFDIQSPDASVVTGAVWNNVTNVVTVEVSERNGDAVELTLSNYETVTLYWDADTGTYLLTDSDFVAHLQGDAPLIFGTANWLDEDPQLLTPANINELVRGFNNNNGSLVPRTIDEYEVLALESNSSNNNVRITLTGAIVPYPTAIDITFLGETYTLPASGTYYQLSDAVLSPQFHEALGTVIGEPTPVILTGY